MNLQTSLTHTPQTHFLHSIILVAAENVQVHQIVLTLFFDFL